MTKSEAAAKLEWIEAQIAAGRTVIHATYTRITPWKPKNYASFKASGIAPFKATDTGLWMYEGSTRGKPRYVCIPTDSGFRAA